MLFNSFEFAVFIVPVFFLYWWVFGKSAARQNILLFIASFVFYAWADWRFFFLLILIAAVNFYLGKFIFSAKNERRKKSLFYMGIFLNLGILSYFKYFGVIYDAMLKMLSHEATLPEIVVPLGVSFFTFQVLGYLIDIYNEETEPEKSLFRFILYVTYFPKLFAGPIEPAQKFLPQITEKRTADYSVFSDGLRQFLWGLFAKLVIADNAAIVANKIFDNYISYSGSTLLIGVFFYAFQVYADFSGYSNMAVGVSKLFGIKLTQNFSMPFFSTDISEYWKKWHISLSTWMMNHVFSPLSFILRKQKKAGLIISILVTFMIVGLWHGPLWTYILFGFMHGCYFIPGIIRGKKTVSSSQINSTYTTVLKMAALFLLVALTMVVFRVPAPAVAFYFYKRLFSLSLFSAPQLQDTGRIFVTFLFILFLMLVEWRQRNREHGLQLSAAGNKILTRPVRWLAYSGLILFILCFQGNESDFIYFKF